jgi:hypothetical protein
VFIIITERVGPWEGQVQILAGYEGVAILSRAARRVGLVWFPLVAYRAVICCIYYLFTFIVINHGFPQILYQRQKHIYREKAVT